ncbi:hypothetical protein UCRNP2_6238 [Neofusicoccum parvum UCRNP2]|uniref:SnoaL-like domain-containing protein n=1 Tax=Botryosphaeria parva (strain UCR-NP2) TaxID=1287680 RepID=R1GM39_BOTPV|nr:hypothetical protein UCRNP2_6238 [Neofusicoccum parvum UCRNP2]
MKYQDYIDAFNNNADESAKAAFFTDDVILQAPYAHLQGRDAVLAMFAAAHSKVKEELRPRLVVQDGDIIMAEVDAAFVAKEDTPGSPFYEFKKGKAVAFRFFGVYKLREDRICEFHLSYWPTPTPIEPF